MKDRAGAQHDPGRRALRQAEPAAASFWTPPAATPGIAYAMIGAGARLPGEALPAGQRLRRAQAHPQGLRRGDGLHRPGRGLRRRHPQVPRDLRSRSGPATSTRTSTTTRPTGRRTTRPPGRRSCEQTDGRVTHFVAAMGTSGTFMGVTRRLRRDLPRREVLSRRSPPAASTAWKA